LLLQEMGGREEKARRSEKKTGCGKADFYRILS